MRLNKLIIILILTIFAVITTAYAGTCFLVRETTDGLYRTCYYDCAGGEVVITVGVAKLCPLSIDCP